LSLGERASGRDSVEVKRITPSRSLDVVVRAIEHARWKLEKFRTREEADREKPYEVVEFEGNCLLNEGINNVLTPLICGGAATAWDNANARIGVGDSSTAEDAGQGGLQAAINKFWKVMMAAFPTYGTSQQSVWKSEFAEGEAQFAWEEFTVVNAADDSGDNLCRKTQSLGTKGAEIWRLTLTVTWS